MPPEYPPLPGSYALFLTLPAPVALTIGKLGAFTFLAGVYIYTGSARGPGGLDARLRHHLRPATRPHWHIDYLRTRAEVRGGVYVVEEEVPTRSMTLECAWSQVLLALPDASVPVRGFGASDCRSGCPAHLLYFPGAADFVARLRAVTEGQIQEFDLVKG
jgi:Uri superfamily endonuclease